MTFKHIANLFWHGFSSQSLNNQVLLLGIYCILCGRIKGLNSSITTILFEVGSYRTVVR